MKRFQTTTAVALSIILLFLFDITAFCQQPRLAGTTRNGGLLNGGSIFLHDLPAISSNTINDFDDASPDKALSGVTRGDGNWLYGTLTYNGTDQTGSLFRIQSDGSQFTKLANLNSTNAVYTTPYFHTDDVLYYASQNGFSKYNTINFTTSLINLPNYALARNLVIDAADWIYYTTQFGIDKVKTDGSFHDNLHFFTAGEGTGGIEGLTEIPGDSLIGVHRFEGGLNGGTLYSIKKDGSAFTILHNFDHGDGRYPQARPFYFDGKLYGTTTEGGLNDNGVVYCINPDGTNYRVIYHFTTSLNGLQSMPGNNLTVTSNGRIFGTFQALHQVSVTFAYYLMFKLDTSGSDYEPFVQLSSQRQMGEWLVGTYIENDENMYLLTNYMGRYDGGVFSVFDTSGNGGDLYHFGFSEIGFDPNKLIKGSDGLLYGTTKIGGNDGSGVIYSIDEQGNDLELLNEFTDADGYEPKGKLLEGSDGKLYGVLSNGGPSFSGGIYSINKNGTGFQMIYTFSGGADGHQPSGSLIEYNGSLYGMTLFGGFFGYGAIFRMNKDGTGHTVLKDFNAAPELGFPQGGLMQYNGYLYGSIGSGGANGFGGIFRMLADGTGYEILHHFNGTDGGYSFVPPIIATNNLVYGITQSGGTSNDGVLYRMEPDGDNYTILKNFALDTDGYYPTDLIQASDGNLYGTTAGNVATAGSNYGGTIYRINLDGTGFTTLFRSNALTQGANVDGIIDLVLGTLPVELITFNGRSENGGVLLSWKTANEQNSERFSIERSTDGLNFVSIGSVRAAGNSSTTLSYNFTDRSPRNGKNYYRLKQIDIDQSFTYSRILMINFGKDAQLVIYPNPATNFLTVVLPKDVKQLKVIDASGRVVIQKQISGSSLTEEIDLRAFAKGVYVLQVHGNAIVSRSFVKE